MIRIWTKWLEKIIFNSNKMVDLYNRYYKNIVKKEITLADIKATDDVLIIGGGAVPCTAINIARKTNAKVDVIDIDRDAVNSASKLVEKLGLENNIKVYLKDGKNMDVEKYDIIHVALQVTPKDEVVNCIWEKCDGGTKVLIRQPKKILRAFYSNLSESFINSNRNRIRTRCTSNGWDTLDNSLLLIKD